MLHVTVFRHVPPPIIGTCGVVRDRGCEVFEERLDWLEAIGCFVERFDPSEAPGEVAARATVRTLLSTEGDRCLPLILVNGVIVSRGGCPSRTQLARAVGRARLAVRRAVARQLAAIGAAAAVGPERAVERQVARAREMGVSEDRVRAAQEVGAALRRAG